MWRLLCSPPGSGADNMALDEALMDRARETGDWILRVYSWSTPTLSLGRNQRAQGSYDLDRLRAHGVDVVRRPTGGRAILHHHEVTYSVTAPVATAGDLRESYGRINRLLLAGLRNLGVDTKVVARSDAAVPDQDPSSAAGLLPCFHHPSIGEITFAGRKLVGSAQWRRQDALLQHGSILIEDDQMQLNFFLTHPSPSVPSAATLSQALGRAPCVAEVAGALFTAVQTLEDSEASTLSVDDALALRSLALSAHYLDDRWTWRR